MACSCTDLLDDLSLKFDLILELIDTVIILLARRGGQVQYPDIATYKMALKADEDFLELLALILPKIL